MHICEGEEVGCNSALICLLQAGDAEWTRPEETRRRISLWGRLVRMEGSTVVLGRPILVPVSYQQDSITKFKADRPAWGEVLLPEPPGFAPGNGVIALNQLVWWWRDRKRRRGNFFQGICRRMAAEGRTQDAGNRSCIPAEECGSAQWQPTQSHTQWAGVVLFTAAPLAVFRWLRQGPCCRDDGPTAGPLLYPARRSSPPAAASVTAYKQSSSSISPSQLVVILCRTAPPSAVFCSTT